MAVSIDYEKAFHASHSMLVRMMEQAYLEGIDLLDSVRLNGTFDQNKFKEEVAAIFSTDKWYELALEKETRY